ncbi:cytochrome d ubiquinol oxidase subunit II [Catenulispora sp. NF23]|uniref:Cytochrome d ubiquinol oxidase subunit II n=1 Tax=Catenulispora pinistramenti TaxID=2705254 RepID=A0ABS5KIM0_9ACTN|nr:cytochrome d ubiquinol oxidase subunit II [Catenulispora pinistramenti]MBS2532359.1 cytochrome d ubiquinol oxidase subunit II [Catenulispora pinistramenti]MBS2546128.1 cytochrome d ubiquinol oxidase subunit II [Catenulispora pinistramenti]
MSLVNFWYLLIAVLWIGYFFLEGFDFGVGILTQVLARDETNRRVLINTIGPVWDGNEVWVITAIGATFAAFPNWYATLLSGFYVPLLLVLLALIVRNVAFEYRGKSDARHRGWWDLCIFVGSLLPPLLWGLVFGCMFSGTKIGDDMNFHGRMSDFLTTLDGIIGALAFLALFLTHGAVYTALKTRGPIRDGARRLAVPGALVSLVLVGVLLGRVNNRWGGPLSWTVAVVPLVALLACAVVVRIGRDGWAFVLSGAAVATMVASMFIAVFPIVMPSSLNPDWSLTVHSAASSHYTLTVMSVVACVFTPLVLLYQGWTYWVFRKRIGVRNIPAAH